MGLLNYTTTISASKTISEMQDALAKAGAAAVAIQYEDGRPHGITFQLRTPQGAQLFTLPVDSVPVQRILAKEKVRGTLAERMQTVAAQADRTAWRVAKSWLEAQLALVQIGLASLDQVMLPYLHVDGDKTLYAAYSEGRDALALTTGRGVEWSAS